MTSDPRSSAGESAASSAQAEPGRLRVPPPKPDVMAHPPSGSGLWNLPNVLTMVRLLLVPPFAWLLLGPYADQDWAQYAAAGVFALASVTDFLDGYLARKRGLVTTFGKIADPIADKVLTGVALIGLSILGQLPWWVTIIILGREVLVTVLRFVVIRHGVIPASRGGKAKTLTQILAITMYLLPLTGFWASARAWVMGLAVVLTIVSGIDYAVRAWTMRQNSDRTAAKRAARAGH